MTTPHDTRPVRTSERAFTLVEIVVVLVIVLLVGGIVAVSIGGTRDQFDTRAGIAHARTVQRAIEEFRLDHAGRVPNPRDASDWDPRRGPLAPDGTSYLRGDAAAAIVDGTVGLCRGATGATPGTPAGVYTCVNGPGRDGQLVLNRVGGSGSWGYWIDLFSGDRNGRTTWTTADHRCSLSGGALSATVRAQLGSAC